MGLISPLQLDSRGNPIQTGHLKEMGKDEFLQLLVAKLTHQDPLEPVTDEAFIADLAQFSSLEQLSNLNNSISDSLDMDYLQMQTINNTMATSLIGREVTANYDTVYLDGDNVPSINFSTTEYPEAIVINIYTQDGSLVRTITENNASIGENSITWDGKDSNGKRLTDGYYRIDISGTAEDGTEINPSTFIKGLVQGVNYHNGAAFLKVNGLEIALADVSSIALAEL